MPENPERFTFPAEVRELPTTLAAALEHYNFFTNHIEIEGTSFDEYVDQIAEQYDPALEEQSEEYVESRTKVDRAISEYARTLDHEALEEDVIMAVAKAVYLKKIGNVERAYYTLDDAANQAHQEGNRELLAMLEALIIDVQRP